MPSIDLSHVIRNPRFSEKLTIKRRQETVDGNGNATTTVTVITPQPVGVVLPGPNNKLERTEDYTVQPKTISVHTPFKLRGPSSGYQPDVINWHGSDFVITKLDDFSNFGTGWVAAEAESINLVDPPPQES